MVAAKRTIKRRFLTVMQMVIKRGNGRAGRADLHVSFQLCWGTAEGELGCVSQSSRLHSPTFWLCDIRPVAHLLCASIDYLIELFGYGDFLSKIESCSQIMGDPI